MQTTGARRLIAEHPVPGRHVEVVDGGEVKDPRAVDEHVDAAVARGGRRRRRFDRTVVGEVEGVGRDGRIRVGLLHIDARLASRAPPSRSQRAMS